MTTVTIPSGKYIKLIAGNTARTISRGSGHTGSLITVASGGSLEMGGGAALTLDGRRLPAQAPLISVGGILTISGNAVTLTNNINRTSYATGGAVDVDGGASFDMQAGSITGNTTVYGGGVAVQGGLFTMGGGSITENTATNSGDGVYMSSGNWALWWTP